LADCARPDSAAARSFAESVNRFLFQPGPLDRDQAARIAQQLGFWNAAGRQVAGRLAGKAPALNETASVAQALAEISLVGRDAMQALLSGHAPDDGWVIQCRAQLHRATEPGPAAVEFPIVPSLELLVAAAAEQDKRSSLAPEAWREHLRAIAFPPAPPTS
jgi:hypothetical protein